MKTPSRLSEQCGLIGPPLLTSITPCTLERFQTDADSEQDISNDREMLETILLRALPRRDIKRVAKALIARFGSYADTISASEPELQRVDRMTAIGVAALKAVETTAQYLLKARVVNQPLLNNWDRLMDYLNARLARKQVEHFLVLFLDSRNRLLADEEQGRGTVNHTPVYPREVVKRALEVQATALILVHNHPSGDPTPSRDDIDMTQEVKQAARSLGIVLHDHIIVGNGRSLSFRREGLL